MESEKISPLKKDKGNVVPTLEKKISFATLSLIVIIKTSINNLQIRFCPSLT